ncbi:MAG: ATP-binding protein [Coriobacteriia bacterium]
MEFKSDRPAMSSSAIYEEVVALANHEGGVLLIGLEDDGSVSGAQPRRGHSIEPAKMTASVFGNTVPPLRVNTSVVDFDGKTVIAIEVPISETIACTAAGVCKRRAFGGDGRPASVPFPPMEHPTRRIDVAGMDQSAALLSTAVFGDLDPVEFARIRNLIERLGGDAALVELGDEDLAKALRLVETRGEDLVPNVTGILVCGRESAIERLLPSHEVRFQVLDADRAVLVNEVYRGPMGKVLEQIGVQFAARNREQEVAMGLLRFPIPDYSPEGFREAFNNAILHRDYARLGAVYVQIDGDGLLVASPGALPRGVTVDNLLVHEPKPRNPRLAEVLRRIGLVEQTGRGIDRIYLGQLRYGRPLPDYSRTDSDGVRVFLRGGDGSLEFTRMVFSESENDPLGLDQMIALNVLFEDRRTDPASVAVSMQRSPKDARRVLEGLVERGLVEARGNRRSREYILSASLYRRLHMESEYVRGRGFDRIQQEQMVLTYVREHGSITRSQAADLCGMASRQASDLLVSMRDRGQLVLVGERKVAKYIDPVLSRKLN